MYSDRQFFISQYLKLRYLEILMLPISETRTTSWPTWLRGKSAGLTSSGSRTFRPSSRLLCQRTCHIIPSLITRAGGDQNYSIDITYCIHYMITEGLQTKSFGSILSKTVDLAKLRIPPKNNFFTHCSIVGRLPV